MAIPRRTSRRPPAAASSLGAGPVAYRTIAEQVAGRLRDAIAQGRFRPAARLLEAPLAREMGTSRAPVREALALLEREGLVVKEPNRGARVVELTEAALGEMASLRAALEGFGASLAAARLSPAELAALGELLERMRRAARRGDFARLLALDFEFHDRICRAAGHRLLYQLWAGMERKIRLFLSATNLRYRDLHGIPRGHADILRALERRNAAAAQAAMARHLGEMLNGADGEPGPAAPRARREAASGRGRPRGGSAAPGGRPARGGREGRVLSRGGGPRA